MFKFLKKIFCFHLHWNEPLEGVGEVSKLQVKFFSVLILFTVVPVTIVLLIVMQALIPVAAWLYFESIKPVLKNWKEKCWELKKD